MDPAAGAEIRTVGFAWAYRTVSEPDFWEANAVKQPRVAAATNQRAGLEVLFWNFLIGVID